MTEERAARYSDLFDPGGAQNQVSDCAYCPFCSAIGVLRTTHPEVLDHLAVAARELMAAASVLLAEAERVVETTRSPGAVRRIDFS
jgi:hypothetical protein